MRKTTITCGLGLAVTLVLIVLVSGCLPEQTDEPFMGSIWPEHFAPPSHPRSVNFFVDSLDPEAGYFLLYIGDEVVPVEPDFIPGKWVFRCPFGYHFTYRFANPREFFESFGELPLDVEIQCFNAGENGIPEYGGGDDVGSNIETWTIYDSDKIPEEPLAIE